LIDGFFDCFKEKRKNNQKKRSNQMWKLIRLVILTMKNRSKKQKELKDSWINRNVRIQLASKKKNKKKTREKYSKNRRKDKAQ
jgi:inactivated superfamily I helicase